MSLFLIIIQMSDPERTDTMVRLIKEYGTWARITDNAWCIKVPDKTAADIRDGFTSKLSIQSTERLLVVNMTAVGWASYYLPKEVTDWLKEK